MINSDETGAKAQLELLIFSLRRRSTNSTTSQAQLGKKEAKRGQQHLNSKFCLSEQHSILAAMTNARFSLDGQTFRSALSLQFIPFYNDVSLSHIRSVR